jgi:hypothetical protein
MATGRSGVELPRPLHNGTQDAVDPGRVTFAILYKPVVNFLIEASGHQHLRCAAKLRQLLVGEGRDVGVINVEIISGSRRFAIRDRTAFWILFAGLLNIDLALTLISFAGRDDADRFFFVIFILHAIYVNNQQHCARCSSYGVPSLFAPHDAVPAENCVRIVSPSIPTQCYTKCITVSIENKPSSR